MERKRNPAPAGFFFFRRLRWLLAAPLLMLSWQLADAARYSLYGWYQRSSGGTLSSLLFKAGAAQGCPDSGATIQPCYRIDGAAVMAPWMAANGLVPVVTGDPAIWDWNGTTLSMTGTLWATSLISNTTNGTPVISDRIANLAITPATSTATASLYQCYEGTFLASAGVNGCLNLSLGANGAMNSTATYNIGGNADCMTRAVGGDDTSTGNPRGLTTHGAGGGCDATAGAANLFVVWQDDANYLVVSSTATLTNPSGDGCIMFGPHDATSPCAADATLGGASYFVLIPDADGDNVRNSQDNCRMVPNNTGASAQCDADGDGFGNHCDGDLGSPAPGNGTTNAQDYGIFRGHLGVSTSPTGPFDVADLNCNGAVNAQDYAMFRLLLGSSPGPGAGP